MSKSRLLAAVTAAMIVSGATSAAHAAPAGALVGAADALKSETSAVETISYRCWWDYYRGRVCAWVPPPRVYGFYGHVGPRPWYYRGYGWRGRHW